MDASTLQDFRVTRYLPLPEIITTLKGEVRDGFVRPVGSFTEIQLSGEDFTRFCGVDGEESAAPLAREYGVLGLERILRTPIHGEVPTWHRALTIDPSGHDWTFEPVEDWTRQSGLMSIALGLIGLLQDQPAIEHLKDIAGRLRGLEADVPTSLDRASEVTITLQRQSVADTYLQRPPWPVKYILDGAARARLVCEGIRVVETPKQQTPKQPTGYFLNFSPWLWVRPGASHSERVQQMAGWNIELSPGGISEALVGLLTPWVERVRLGVLPHERGAAPALMLPSDLLSTLWLQLANVAVGEVHPRLCAFSGCPGPPERPGVFLWRWGKPGSGTKHRDSIYCHPRCKNAASQQRYRGQNRREER